MELHAPRFGQGERISIEWRIGRLEVLVSTRGNIFSGISSREESDAMSGFQSVQLLHDGTVQGVVVFNALWGVLACVCSVYTCIVCDLHAYFSGVLVLHPTANTPPSELSISIFDNRLSLCNLCSSVCRSATAGAVLLVGMDNSSWIAKTPRFACWSRIRRL